MTRFAVLLLVTMAYVALFIAIRAIAGFEVMVMFGMANILGSLVLILNVLANIFILEAEDE